MNLNFILMEMTHLRYWMPLVIEGNSRGLQSTFFVGASNKYNCPTRCIALLKEISKEQNIKMKHVFEISSAKGLMFSSEKTGINYLDSLSNCKKVISTYQTDFIECYKEYAEKADHILMPSEFCAEFYDRKSNKNLYLGIPKYDTELKKEEILNKYNLSPDKKYVTYIAPKARDQAKVDSRDVISYLHNSGYTVLFKSRGKDPIDPEWHSALKKLGHHSFEDTSWYPHTTQELLEISDFAVNFGSTTIEECIMHDVPLINFDVKPAVRNGSKRPYRVTHEYLYNYKYCIQLEKDFSQAQFSAAVSYLTSTDLTEEFKKARQNHLFDHKDSCKRMLDVLI